LQAVERARLALEVGQRAPAADLCDEHVVGPRREGLKTAIEHGRPLQVLRVLPAVLPALAGVPDAEDLVEGLAYVQGHVRGIGGIHQVRAGLVAGGHEARHADREALPLGVGLQDVGRADRRFLSIEGLGREVLVAGSGHDIAVARVVLDDADRAAVVVDRAGFDARRTDVAIVLAAGIVVGQADLRRAGHVGDGLTIGRHDRRRTGQDPEILFSRLPADAVVPVGRS